MTPENILPDFTSPGDSLDSGAAGIALLHIERARIGTGTWATAHEIIKQSTRKVRAHPDIASLYQGAPAVAFALHTADLPSYSPVLAKLDSHITTVIQHRLQQAHDRIDRADLPSWREFDLISGLTGLGTYILHRNHNHELLREVLSYLVRLTHPICFRGETLPGWWCFEQLGSEAGQQWAGGHGNLGLAHGIAGPLALLAIAMRRGFTVLGQAEAISTICHWFDQWQCAAGKQIWWPGYITRAELHSGSPAQRGPRQPSWCYGTPGIVRAQQLAALALGNSQQQHKVEKSLLGCVSDEGQLAKIIDPGLCHGWAGLVQAVWRVAADSVYQEELAASVRYLNNRLIQHLSQHGPPQEKGLLLGTAGIYLAQETIAANQHLETIWDACLLLQG